MNNLKNKVFSWDLTLKMLYAPVFMVLFVIGKSKYVGVRSFKAIGGVSLLEVRPLSVYMRTHQELRKTRVEHPSTLGV